MTRNKRRSTFFITKKYMMEISKLTDMKKLWDNEFLCNKTFPFHVMQYGKVISDL